VPDLTSPAFQIAYLVGTSVVFAIVALVTRPTRRRLFGAICAIGVFTAISAPIDEIGARTKLWTYPALQEAGHPSTIIYLGQATIFVGSIALIGWRVHRAYGFGGLVRLTIAVLVLGCIRDFSAAAIFPDLLHFGPQPGALLGDAAAWGAVALVALVVPAIVDRGQPATRS
jgi:hypothetical protein